MNRSDFSTIHTLRVRYSEIDAQGIVYNPHFLSYFDYAITELNRERGLPVSIKETAATGFDFNAVKAVVEYKAPAEFDDTLDICCRVGRLGNSSITYELAIIRQEDDELIATGEVIWVYADQKERKSVRIPDDLREKLAA